MVREAAKVITMLEPKPGRDYGGQEPTYIVPDVYIQKVGDDYVVTLNEGAVPRLRLAGYYQRVLNDGAVAAATKEYLQERMRSARLLVEVDLSAPADDLQGGEFDRQVSARVFRPRHQPSEAAGAEGRGRGHRDARIDHQPRHRQQVRAYAAGDLRAQVLLHLGRQRRAAART